MKRSNGSGRFLMLRVPDFPLPDFWFAGAHNGDAMWGMFHPSRQLGGAIPTQ